MSSAATQTPREKHLYSLFAGLALIAAGVVEIVTYQHFGRWMGAVVGICGLIIVVASAMQRRGVSDEVE